MIGQTVTIVRGTPGGRDEYGDTIAGTSERIDVTGCAVAPRSSERRTSDEGTERGRYGVIVGLSLYAPPGTVLRRTDQIEIDGVLYDVDGETGVWRNPYTTAVRGVEVALRRAEG